VGACLVQRFLALVELAETLQFDVWVLTESDALTNSTVDESVRTVAASNPRVFIGFSPTMNLTR